jgi:hypothetical protein
MSYAILILFLSASTIQVDRDSLTIDDLIKLHKAAISSVRSLHVQINITDNKPHDFSHRDAVPLKDLTKHYDIEWAIDEERECWRIHNYRDAASKTKTNETLTEESNESAGYRFIKRAEPTKPLNISEANAGALAAHVSQGKRRLQALGAPVRSDLEMLFFYAEEVHAFITLEEYVKRATKKRVDKTPSTSPLGCYDLVLENLAQIVTISLDPKRNFWARRVEARDKKSDSLVYIRETHEFEQFPNSVHLPKRKTLKSRGGLLELNGGQRQPLR